MKEELSEGSEHTKAKEFAKNNGIEKIEFVEKIKNEYVFIVFDESTIGFPMYIISDEINARFANEAERENLTLQG